MNNDQEFLKRLKKIFRIEADENLSSISKYLLEIEKENDESKIKQLIETPLREAHSLKGSARSVNLPDIVTICQHLESAFAAIKKGEKTISPNFFNVSYEAIDSIRNILEDKEQPIYSLIKKITGLYMDNYPVNEINEKKEYEKKFSDEKKTEVETENKKEIIPVKLKENTEQKNTDNEINHTPTPYTPFEPIETVRIAINKLDSMLFKTEELLSVKLSTEQRLNELKKLNYNVDMLEKELFNTQYELKKVIEKISNEMKIPLANFTKINEIFLSQYEKIKKISIGLNTTVTYYEQDKDIINSAVDNLLDDVKKTLMMPFSSVSNIFPRMVRDIATQQSKEIDFKITGSEIEIDKRILEEIKEPLIHILRNSVDHGIELPEERVKNNKSRKGNITLAVSQTESSRVEILIYDDGKGIDKDKIIEKSLALNLIKNDEISNITENEIISMIFNSGFSTSSMITDISGMGLGLAIVKEKVEKLGGIVNVTSDSKKNTVFKITLPLTLATFRGLVIRIGEKNFVIPLLNVEHVIRINKDEIKNVEDKQNFLFKEQIVPVIQMKQLLNLKESNSTKQPDFIQIVILFTTDKKIAFVVDEVLYEQEVMIKSLGKQLIKIPNIGGVTILGSGKVVPLLNPFDLIKTVAKNNYSFKTEKNKLEKKQKKNILVAEDSITSRTLLKNILETSGYNVKTTVDGLEAFNTLKTENFDLVISDVEMPRMNGFELTEKIRQTNEISDIPVILITSLSSKEHKKKGVEVGANAYIVKTEFEQENLLEIIPRLI